MAIVITGNTYLHRDALKNIAARWNARRNGWIADDAHHATVVALPGVKVRRYPGKSVAQLVYEKD